MLKKKILVLALVAGLSVGMLHAQQLSAGGGAMLDLSGSGLDITAAPGALNEHVMDTNGYGAFIFLSGNFIEFSVGFVFGDLYLTAPGAAVAFPAPPLLNSSFFALDFTLLARQPFYFGNHAIFPMVGAGAQVMFMGGDFGDAGEVEASIGNLSNLRLILGFGTDIAITEGAFFRGQVLGYYRFASRFERDMANQLTDTGAGATPPAIFDANGGFGLQLRMGLGFRF